MPNDWNPEIYRARAKQWQDKAAALPPGDERQACEGLAQGYARLAQLIEQAKKGAFSEPPPNAARCQDQGQGGRRT
jgi:hypothetical protein